MIVSHFSMQKEDVNEHTNVMCLHLQSLADRSVPTGPKPHDIIEHTYSKNLVSTLAPSVMSLQYYQIIGR